jgi:hypothetical protein
MTVPGHDRTTSVPAGCGISSTLQAILQFSNGGMESVATPIPLPEAIVHIMTTGSERTERFFRRARSPDSVIRYVEVPEIEGSATRAIRQCARCGQSCALLFVPKLASDEPVSAATGGYCGECYTVMAPQRSSSNP